MAESAVRVLSRTAIRVETLFPPATDSDSTGPSWRQAVSDAAHQCTDGRPTALIQHDPPGWFFGLACTHLTHVP
jgi:hypothetical protein